MALDFDLVSFDVTGTLLEPVEMPRVYSEVLSRHGIEIEERAIAELFPTVWRELDCQVPAGVDRFRAHPGGARGYWRQLLERICALAEVAPPSRFAASELFDRFAQAGCWRVFSDVRETLERLRTEGYRLVILSNWDERLPLLLSNLDLDRAFDDVVYSSAIGIAKPAAEIFHHAASRAGCSVTRMLHVGDSKREDVEGAVAAGAASILLDRRDRAPSPGPQITTLTSLDDLPDLLASESQLV